LSRTVIEPLAVITNQRSTFNLRNDAWIDPLVAGEPDVGHFRIRQAGEIGATVRRCAAMGARTIVVNGGDGTAGLVFAALLNDNGYRELPALALLSGGKTNMTAAGWSLAGEAGSALASIMKHRRNGGLAPHLVERPILRVRREREAPLYGAFFGAGDVVDGILFCRRRLYPLNLPTPLSHAAAITTMFARSLLRRGRAGPVDIADASGRLEQGRFFFISVTALDELVLGVKPAPAESTPAALHYVSVRKGCAAVLNAVPSVLKRRIAPGLGRTVRRTDRLTLRFDGLYTLDGELYEARADRPVTLDGGVRLRFLRLPH
jgi:hypothetical protein